MFTAEEYRTAAKVLDEEYGNLSITGAGVAARDLHLIADQLETRDAAAYAIGANVALWRQTMGPTNLGLEIFGALIRAGWTPPEGLF